MRRMTSQNVIKLLLFFSLFILTFQLYRILSEITFSQEIAEIFKRQEEYNTRRNSLNKFTDSNVSPESDVYYQETESFELRMRSRFVTASEGYAVIAAKENNKSTFSTQLACASELFVEECNGAGLAAMLLMTLDHLGTCRHIGAVPTVFWRNCGTVCPSNATVNSWNWFFEPLNPNIEEKAKRVLCFGNSFGVGVFSLEPLSKTIKFDLKHFPDLLNLSFKPRHIPGYEELDLITPKIRLWANSLLRLYVKINPQIQEIVDKFYDEHLFGHTVLAIHVRGTDHGLETEDGKLPPLMSWIQNAKTILKSLPTPNKIFIASDNSESIKKFINEFGKKIVFTKAFRSTKYHGRAVHTVKYDPYKLGAEVLVDILLMARADHFLHAESSVAALVSYFNPEIHTHFLESKPETVNKFRQTGNNNVNFADTFYDDGHSDKRDDDLEGRENSFECFQMNSQHSVCPNMRKEIFIDPRELRELAAT